MKLAHLLPELETNIRAVLAHHNMDLKAMDHGKTGLKAMWSLLAAVSQNLAYNDSHPMYVQGVVKRILPYDGRDYCWYYEGGADDSHVATLLKKIKSNIYGDKSP